MSNEYKREMEQVINLSDYDRGLMSELIDSNNRLAAALEAKAKGDYPLYTSSQAAAFLGVNIATISRMLADKRLHKVYENRMCGIRRSELEKYKGPRGHNND